MPGFADYKDSFSTVKLERSPSGVLEVTLHNNGGPFEWEAHFDPLKPSSKVTHRGGHGELGDALATIARDLENRVVIITGAGDFWAGRRGDQSKGTQQFRGDTGPDFWDDMNFHGSNLLLDLLDIPAPVIFCFNGPAYRHPEFPFTGDIVLAADDVFIEDPHFINNVVPGDGVQLMLGYFMGWGRARYFHLTGQRIAAQELKDLGLVNEIMPRERLLPRAHELAEKMAQLDTLVLRYTRFVLTAPLKALVRQYVPYSRAMEAIGALAVQTRSLSAAKVPVDGAAKARS